MGVKEGILHRFVKYVSESKDMIKITTMWTLEPPIKLLSVNNAMFFTTHFTEFLFRIPVV